MGGGIGDGLGGGRGACEMIQGVGSGDGWVG